VLDLLGVLLDLMASIMVLPNFTNNAPKIFFLDSGLWSCVYWRSVGNIWSLVSDSGRALQNKLSCFIDMFYCVRGIRMVILIFELKPVYNGGK
jgi:hypothetical protein